MVQQVPVGATNEQWTPREPGRRAHASVPDLIVAARRRILPGAARLRAPVVAASTCMLAEGNVRVKLTAHVASFDNMLILFFHR